ncbi:antitoxin [Candidatus Magnetomorum sp. HK-1]|nr:antitoxin [Candidatus Magnetomorum sp. HK-1]
MTANTIRMNITLPKNVAKELNEITSQRKRSYFIADAIMQKISQYKKEVLRKSLEEGYKAMAKESLNISKEYESVDLEGWHDY